jgi:hypothetical protein
MQPVASTMAMDSYANANKLMALRVGMSLKRLTSELPIRSELFIFILESYNNTPRR